MFSQILSIVTMILGRSDRWRDKTLEQRKRVAEYCHALADCLTRVAADLRAGKVPHSACSELAMYALRMPRTVQEELGSEADNVQRVIQSAVGLRTMAVKAADAEAARDYLAAIEEGAGKMKALAVSLAVG